MRADRNVDILASSWFVAVSTLGGRTARNKEGLMSSSDESSVSNRTKLIVVGIIVLISAAIAIHLADSGKGGPCGSKASIFGTAIKCKEGLECRFRICETPIPKPAWGCRIFERNWGEQNVEAYAFDQSDATNVRAARVLAVGLYQTTHPDAKKVDGNCYACEERLADVESRSVCKLDE
jgi:hypothetical protein